MAITKIHAIKSTLSNVILYIENPSKTDGQLLVSGYNVEPQTAALDFEITAMMAHKVHHISCKKTSNLAYHLIQSFSPTEKITPREAHDLGRKLALEFTEGKYEFVIATHIDKGHIHNHIIINSVSFYDYKKLRTVLLVFQRQAVRPVLPGTFDFRLHHKLDNKNWDHWPLRGHESPLPDFCCH